MTFNEAIKTTFDEIIKHKNYNGGKILKDYITKTGGWPNGHSKEKFFEALDYLLTEELPDDPVRDMIDMTAGVSRKMPKISKKQREALEDIRKFVEETKLAKECDHKNAAIAPFLHGGGFTPTFALPEFICPDCGLNVTLCHHYIFGRYGQKKSDIRLLGTLDISEEEIKEMERWAFECMNMNRTTRKKVLSSNSVSRDPLMALQKSDHKWNGRIPKILNKKKFESLSGV